MENFLKQNWFKLALLMVLLIVGLSYIFYSVPQKGKVGYDNKEKCAEQAQAYMQNIREINSESENIDGSLINALNDQYTYNSSLNTCLVYFEVAESGAGTTYNIVDLLTNQTIYTHLRYQSQHARAQELWDENCNVNDGCFVDRNDFIDKFNELFKK